jgi:type II secretory pathway pseudopilin PulG
MIEIAISLAIIGIALVAIIGVLPIGMNTQKVNREETIINQDSTVWINAIRNGAKGLDDLTNYVLAITNYVTVYDRNMVMVPPKPPPIWYTTTNSSTPLQYPLTNGLRIVGLLSTPKYVLSPGAKGGDRILSNNVVAYVRSMSGAASEKFPQDSGDVKDFGFCYRMTSEVVPYGTNYYDPTWTNYTVFPTNTPEHLAGYNSWRMANTMQANLHDMRLIFRWPLRSRGQLGLGGQTYRTLVGGSLRETNEPGFLRPDPPQRQPSAYDLYFFEPRTYVTNAP